MENLFIINMPWLNPSRLGVYHLTGLRIALLQKALSVLPVASPVYHNVQESDSYPNDSAKSSQSIDAGGLSSLKLWT